MYGAGEEIFRLKPGALLLAPGEEILEGVPCQAGQQIQVADPVSGSDAGVPGKLEDGGAAEAIGGELDFSPIFHGGFAVLGQPQAADCPNALQRGAAGIGGLQLYQGRAQLGAVVAQTLEEPVA